MPSFYSAMIAAPTVGIVGLVERLDVEGVVGPLKDPHPLALPELGEEVALGVAQIGQWDRNVLMH